MEISDDLRCLFTAQITEHDGSYVLEVPEQEVAAGMIHPGDTYRVGMLSFQSESGSGRAVDAGQDDQAQAHEQSEPPVDEGEVRTVEIEDIGSQGDGIARVERGYVIIVPETERGDTVTIEVTQVRDSVAFGEVIEEPPAQ